MVDSCPGSTEPETSCTLPFTLPDRLSQFRKGVTGSCGRVTRNLRGVDPQQQTVAPEARPQGSAAEDELIVTIRGDHQFQVCRIASARVVVPVQEIFFEKRGKGLRRIGLIGEDFFPLGAKLLARGIHVDRGF